MIHNLLTRVVGSRNQRLLRRIDSLKDRINDFEARLGALTDPQLQALTPSLQQRLQAGEPLDALMPEAFAVVREASKRTIGLRHFDVQMIGGAVLHQGKIAEMKTGEGKTLVATLPAYLNALGGEPVHIVTVNDYLAQRDAEWMGKIFEFLGMSVGVVVSGQQQQEKQQAYQANIVYGTNNEFGFDYLRDNMAFSSAQRAQRGLHYAIVDEVDSILIDEARTPLIISGPAEEDTELYYKINEFVPSLQRQLEEEGAGDFFVDEKARQVFLTEAGHERAEEMLSERGMLQAGESLYDVNNIVLLHHLNAALRAHSLYARDVDYIVKDGEIVIIDEFTGRMMAGRRWSEGLHQAVEARERLTVHQENQTLASITFQNYFRLYDKLAGMTGTADTEAAEFQQIYDLEVVIVPTHQPMVREDHADRVYRSAREKFDAIVRDLAECQARGQPVLVGTASIEVSEYLSQLLNKGKIKHSVLNAKQHEREANIVADAGRPGAVTIATNMAGRGTDIVLGGNLDMELEAAGAGGGVAADTEALRAGWDERHQQVVASGGLYVLSTERHESRRVDNQLRGRSGRQGDPGSSCFYLSLEDNLMRIFGTERVSSLMTRLGMVEGEVIEHTWVNRAIENAQRKVEGRNFDTRKQLLEYDDVANEQRKVVYGERNRLMEVDDVSDSVSAMRVEVVNGVIDQAVPPQSLEEQWDPELLENLLQEEFKLEAPVKRWLAEEEQLHEEALRERIMASIERQIDENLAVVPPEELRRIEKSIMLNVLDQQWKEHLAGMDHLRQGIHLRGYAQKNPRQEYKREAYELFTTMLGRTRQDTIKIISRLEVRSGETNEQLYQRRRPQSPMQLHSGDNTGEAAAGGGTAAPRARRGGGGGGTRRGAGTRRGTEGGTRRGTGGGTYTRKHPKVGRNDPCPCGSGKKYKRCHGAGGGAGAAAGAAADTARD